MKYRSLWDKTLGKRLLRFDHCTTSRRKIVQHLVAFCRLISLHPLIFHPFFFTHSLFTFTRSIKIYKTPWTRNRFYHSNAIHTDAKRTCIDSFLGSITLTIIIMIMTIIILSNDHTNDNDPSLNATLYQNLPESGRNFFSGLPFVFQAKAPALEVGILRVRPEWSFFARCLSIIIFFLFFFFIIFLTICPPFFSSLLSCLLGGFSRLDLADQECSPIVVPTSHICITLYFLRLIETTIYIFFYSSFLFYDPKYYKYSLSLSLRFFKLLPLFCASSPNV